MNKFQALKQEFKESIQRFQEALKQRKTDFMRDSCIKRFEFTFDLSWKAVKACLEKRGIRCASPVACFKEAFSQGILDYDPIWIKMVETRNYTVHTYNEDLAEYVYKELPEALAAFQKLHKKLSEEPWKRKR